MNWDSQSFSKSLTIEEDVEMKKMPFVVSLFRLVMLVFGASSLLHVEPKAFANNCSQCNNNVCSGGHSSGSVSCGITNNKCTVSGGDCSGGGIS